MNTFLPLISCCAIGLATSQLSFAQSPATPAAPAAPASAAPTPSLAASPASAVPAVPNPAAPDPYFNTPLEYNPSAMVRVDVLMVSLSEDKALPLISKLRDPEQIQAAQEKLIEMVGKKEATLEGWPEVTVHSGERAVSESIMEQRYPIEYEEPVSPSAVPATQKSELTPAQRALISMRTSDLIIPTTFETRNAGPTLEAQPIISPDGKAVGLQLSPQLVRLELMRAFAAGVTEKGTKVAVEQPIFSTAKISTALSLRDGERRLVYVGKSGEPRTRIDLFVVGVKIIPPPVAKP